MESSKIVVLFLLVLAQNYTCQIEKQYYVLANRSSKCTLKYNACYTLDVYVEKSVDYFTNHSKFVFQEGSHVMEKDLLLTVMGRIDLLLMSEGNEMAVIDCGGEFTL